MSQTIPPADFAGFEEATGLQDVIGSVASGADSNKRGVIALEGSDAANMSTAPSDAGLEQGELYGGGAVEPLYTVSPEFGYANADSGLQVDYGFLPQQIDMGTPLSDSYSVRVSGETTALAQASEGAYNKLQAQWDQAGSALSSAWQQLSTDPIGALRQGTSAVLSFAGNALYDTALYASDQIAYSANLLSGGFIPATDAIQRNVGRTESFFCGVYNIEQAVDNKDYALAGGLAVAGFEDMLLTLVTRGRGRLFDDVVKSDRLDQYSVNVGRVDYGDLDALGRPTGVRATITEDMIGTGTPANPSIIPPGWSGNGTLYNEARGHLLGNQLGGSGDMVENLVTLQQNPANSPFMRGFENQVRRAVEAGQTIQYSSTPIYNGSNLVPRGITLSGSGSGEFSLNVTILNPPGF